MAYRLAADGVLILHLGFIVWVVCGGWLVPRRPRLAVWHLPALAWAVSLELNGWRCPLTPLENLLRGRAGQAGFEDGFIEHYLLGVIYPAGLTPTLQVWLGLSALLISLPPYVWLIQQKWRRRR
ncbi:DUF2784 domain-containing protein [Kushneria marisflavi]|uniref:Uncharacterized protein n=1 Tax=Kushneria marisflavi TaxID=157779 RepID=A0A240ULW1_9GAMM|nr:DUF2784 domain-containing protein [Kushneria marisflavi]ART62481.1 hypothetical protein B9H00_04965 [Kushneria marisflavi]RKD87606.1 uncharacterized protein DUF2784 [Kushneria marisflavi]